MTPQAIDAELSRDPYVPVRLHVSDGHSYEVRNPGLCLIMRGTLYIARLDRPSRDTDNMDVIGCSHVTRIEPINEEPAAVQKAPPRRN